MRLSLSSDFQIATSYIGNGFSNHSHLFFDTDTTSSNLFIWFIHIRLRQSHAGVPINEFSWRNLQRPANEVGKPGIKLQKSSL